MGAMERDLSGDHLEFLKAIGVGRGAGDHQGRQAGGGLGVGQDADQ
jgi:hypothetical protein